MWTRLCLCTLLIAALYQFQTSCAALIHGKAQEVHWESFSEGKTSVNHWTRRLDSSVRARAMKQTGVDYLGDYSPVHNSNSFTTPSPPNSSGRRRLMQDYAPIPNKSKSPRGRKLLQDYNPAPNPSAL